MSATVDEPNSSFGVERGNYVGEELQHILFRARFPTTFKDDSGVLEDRRYENATVGETPFSNGMFIYHFFIKHYEEALTITEPCGVLGLELALVKYGKDI